MHDVHASKDPHLHSCSPCNPQIRLLLYPIDLELEGGRSSSESERLESPDATNIAKTRLWDTWCGIRCRAADKTRHKNKTRQLCVCLSVIVFLLASLDYMYTRTQSRYRRCSTWYLCSTIGHTYSPTVRDMDKVHDPPLSSLRTERRQGKTHPSLSSRIGHLRRALFMQDTCNASHDPVHTRT
jgi:hypothetical protein